MKLTRRTTHGGFSTLLSDEAVRRVEDQDGRVLYAAEDVVAALTGTADPAKYWTDLKMRELALVGVCEPATR